MARLGRVLAATLLVLLCPAPVPASAQPASPEQLAAAVARPAMVLLRTTWHGWVRDKRTDEVFGGAEGYRVTTTCSGAVIGIDGYVATAGHCVDPGPEGGRRLLIERAVAELGRLGRVLDKNRAIAELTKHGVVEGAEPDRPLDRQLQVERLVATPKPATTDVAPATVVDFRPHSEGDVAVVKVPRGRLPALEIAELDDLPAGTPILAVGYPGSADQASDPTLEPSNKDGQISNRRQRDGLPFYEISAAASQGMSGGPVIDMQGRVVGLVSAAPAGETQAFNLVAASSMLADLVAGNEVPTGLGANDRNYRAGLERFFDGQDGAAVELFDAVLAATPWHQQAAEYRELAAERGAGGPDLDEQFMVLIAVLGAIGLATGGVGVLLAVQRRRTRMLALAGQAGPAEPSTEPLPVVTPVEAEPAEPEAAAPEAAVPAVTEPGEPEPPPEQPGPAGVDKPG